MQSVVVLRQVLEFLQPVTRMTNFLLESFPALSLNQYYEGT